MCWDIEMMKRQLAMVHGHKMTELEHLLQDACVLFDDDVSLACDSLGGWSNINIRGHSTGIDFVLKLPWTISSHDISFYRHLNDISLLFNKQGIAALPLSMGNLSDTLETPFIIFEYIDGVTHDTLLEFAPHEIKLLKQTFQILSQQNPPNLKRYKSPSDHLTTAYALVENHEGFSNSSQEVAVLIDSFNEIYPEVLSYTDSLGVWRPTIMHGDLWAPNIVLHSGKAVLLDFEACAYGSSLYDFAYLLETPVIESVDKLVGLLSPDDADGVNSLRPLVVSFLVTWSLERLMSMESGLVEPNLSTTESKSAIIGYVRSKISRLKTLIA
jgi:thiamine kinase-like enzyme